MLNITYYSIIWFFMLFRSQEYSNLILMGFIPYYLTFTLLLHALFLIPPTLLHFSVENKSLSLKETEVEFTPILLLGGLFWLTLLLSLQYTLPTRRIFELFFFTINYFIFSNFGLLLWLSRHGESQAIWNHHCFVACGYAGFGVIGAVLYMVLGTEYSIGRIITSILVLGFHAIGLSFGIFGVLLCPSLRDKLLNSLGILLNIPPLAIVLYFAF